ncbi:PQQ-binding-like beta-propeller repeat protein [Bryobacter aggregatus]|uniref:outer membrane protein assembly factor BamB family protein n=1 Tax=Bryobacter aggregatus TaxID=360054 RepID=UPI00055E7C80|nr:PQQ-binding-like beta-propeller repeat protein [Bryobacter aggregatus]
MRFPSLLLLSLSLLAAEPQYSPLKQITPANVAKLAKAWEFDTNDAFQGSEMQCRPVFSKGILYVTSPKGRLLALDAASGQQRWAFDPNPANQRATKFRNRGVTLYESGTTTRIFYSIRQHLYAIDGATGKPVPSFGAGGKIDLREGLGRPAATLSVSNTSPGAIYKDLLILGSIVSEDLPAAPGFIRAYDVHTGALRWTFHTIPQPGEPGAETWPAGAHEWTGGANNWSGMTLDAARGTVFVPTGSASFDFYGANRVGDNLYANCLLALDASSGKLKWHFQFVKHDVWDRDLPTAPVLVTVKRNGRKVEAVAQATKSGFVFVFDRDSGKPLFDLKEVEVEASAIPGEKLATKQVLPLKPPPFARQQVTEEILTTRTPEAHQAALARFRKLKTGPQFTPPSTEGTFVFPGFDGGAEWGGQAFDPKTGLFYVNANEMAWILRIVPRVNSSADAKALYDRNCASCHRPDLAGTPPEFPSLIGIATKLPTDDIRRIIREGAGRMPAFSKLTAIELRALTNYIATGANEAIASTDRSLNPQLPYTTDGYNKFLDSEGYPAIQPPWGTLSAIDLNKGTIAWQVPLGEHPKLNQPNTGSENYGGPIVTASGLVFIAATNFDQKIRAFDKRNGKLLWQSALPASGNATPEVYEWQGRQYLVIACGGGKSGAPSGSKYVAFALPQQ